MIQPLHDRVLLERIKDKPGRIILTDPDPIRKAKVVAIGPDVYDLEVGDIVVLPGIAADQPDHEQGKQILVQMADIGCKLAFLKPHEL